MLDRFQLTCTESKHNNVYYGTLCKSKANKMLFKNVQFFLNHNKSREIAIKLNETVESELSIFH